MHRWKIRALLGFLTLTCLLLLPISYSYANGEGLVAAQGGTGKIFTEPSSVGQRQVLLAYRQLPLVATYTGPEGITINSYASAWPDLASLQAVYHELLANYHQGELSYLKEVDLYPNYPFGEGVAGQYFGNYQWDTLGRRYYKKDAVIEIYGTNQRTQLEELAKTIAHEYGHHFTMYYLWIKEGLTFDDWAKTGYAKVRGLVGDSRVTLNGDHQWNPAEMAAEDYVQLFGSPLARKSYQFANQFGSFNSNMFNISPQENLTLPLAAQVDGLEAYWLKLAGDTQTVTNLPPLSPTLALTDTGMDLQGYTWYQLSWSKSLDAESDHLEYTLVSYEPGDTLASPVQVQVDGDHAVFTNYNRLKGKMMFRVFVKDEGNKLVSSNVLEVNLNQPVIQEIPLDPVFRDVSIDYWAGAIIDDLASSGLVTGYQDKTFRPDKPVTRAEFVTMLIRALQLPVAEQPPSFVDTKDNWAQGYIESAKAAGLVGGYADGSFRPDQKITRAEMAVIVTRALGLKITGDLVATEYTDLDGHWAAADIQLASAAEIINGYPDGSFRPNRSLSRAETAVVISRIQETN